MHLPLEETKGFNILDPRQLLVFAQDTSREGRAKLATAVSGVFERADINETEQKLASNILMNLIRQAEIDLREALAERVSAYDNVPKELIVFLANDEISVAKPVLLHSPVLNDLDLIHVIQSKGGDYWQAIASRESVSPVVMDRLIDTKDPSTILKIVDNERMHIQKGCLKKIIKVSMASEELQAPLLRRPEVDAEAATEIYMVVSQALRREIAKRFPVNQGAIEHAMDSLVQEMSNEARGAAHTSQDMVSLAERLKERNEITFDLMIKTLRRGQSGFFVALFAAKSGFTPGAVLRLIQSDGGKPFVAVCRTLGMYKPDVASIFLLSRGLRSGDKIVDQRELAMALKYYEGTKDFDVERLVGVWRKNPETI